MSENDVEWALDDCRVRARFDLPGEAIVRAVVVAADPALELAEDPVGEGQTVRPLGRGRFLVERTAAEPGPTRFRLRLRMPLVDPVGSFDVPGAWLEDVGNDARTVRLSASPDLMAALASAADDRDEPLGGDDMVRRYEAGRGMTAPATRLTVVRRHQEIRGAQTLAARLLPDGVDLRLQARIDASSMPLTTIPVEVPPGCEIGRVTMREDDLATPEAGARLPLDLQWSMAAPDRLVVIVQQPRAGRYRLEIDGRLPLRPAARGRLPLLRAELAGGSPLGVSWSRGDGQPAAVTEVPAGEDGPPYDLAAEPPTAREPAASVRDVRPPEAVALDARDRVERVLITAALDDRGRLRGLARYDLVAAGAVIRLRLPPHTRLFDVLVDGRDVDATPVASDAWEVPLHEAAWPRSLVVVFTGELETADGAGQPIRLLPPMIEGVPCDEVLWSITPPSGRGLRVAAPAMLLDESGWELVGGAARSRIDAAFARALSTAADSEADRLRSYAVMRAAGRSTPLEAAWEQALGATAAGVPVRVVATGDGGLTVRVVRVSEATGPGRVAVSIGLAAAVAWVWVMARRSGRIRAALRPAASWAVPALLVIGGGLWAATLAPAVPGWLLLGTGLALAATRPPTRRPPAVAERVRPEPASTRTLPGV